MFVCVDAERKNGGDGKKKRGYIGLVQAEGGLELMTIQNVPRLFTTATSSLGDK